MALFGSPPSVRVCENQYARRGSSSSSSRLSLAKSGAGVLTRSLPPFTFCSLYLSRARGVSYIYTHDDAARPRGFLIRSFLIMSPHGERARARCGPGLDEMMTMIQLLRPVSSCRFWQALRLAVPLPPSGRYTTCAPRVVIACVARKNRAMVAGDGKILG